MYFTYWCWYIYLLQIIKKKSPSRFGVYCFFFPCTNFDFNITFDVWGVRSYKLHQKEDHSRRLRVGNRISMNRQIFIKLHTRLNDKGAYWRKGAIYFLTASLFMIQTTVDVLYMRSKDLLSWTFENRISYHWRYRFNHSTTIFWQRNYKWLI